jgi:ATP-dependent protease ClpP protease subunit
MPDLPDLSAYEQWWREHVRQPAVGVADWFRIEAAEAKKPKSAEVWIYDRIGASMWDEGTSAKDFARKLKALDVEEITLHLNSPGGNAFDGIAIFNTLKDHPARVGVIVDGLAASAASFIAQSGDMVRMNKGSQMMIHDAAGIVIGNPKDMREFADVLDKCCDSIAGIYASRAGGDVADWREAMSKESWYTAQEAVDAGLADELADEKTAEPKARASHDLRIFAYAGRDKAPPPTSPDRIKAPAGPSADPPTQEGAGMDPAKLRTDLDLPVDASDEDVSAKIAALRQAATPPTEKPGDPPVPKTAADLDAVTDDTAIVVDAGVLKRLQDSARRGEHAYEQLQQQRRDSVISAAIRDGKFEAARRQHYEDLWDLDPVGTEKRIKNLAPGLIPTDPAGYAGGDEVLADRLYGQVYPETEPAGVNGNG